MLSEGIHGEEPWSEEVSGEAVLVPVADEGQR